MVTNWRLFADTRGRSIYNAIGRTESRANSTATLLCLAKSRKKRKKKSPKKIASIPADTSNGRKYACMCALHPDVNRAYDREVTAGCKQSQPPGIPNIPCGCIGGRNYSSRQQIFTVLADSSDDSNRGKCRPLAGSRQIAFHSTSRCSTDSRAYSQWGFS